MATPPTRTHVHRHAVRVLALLAARDDTVAVAETTAGGLLSAMLAESHGGAPFLGGVIAYSHGAKLSLLGLTPDAVAHGAVNGEIALAMARGARSTLGATWGLAETGIAGPQTGRRSTKPAGLAYVAVAGPEERVKEVLTGLDDRVANQRAFALAALALLEDALTG